MSVVRTVVYVIIAQQYDGTRSSSDQNMVIKGLLVYLNWKYLKLD
jgi:hypothetical protein